MHYRLPDRDAPKAVKDAVTWVRHNLADSPQLAQDRKRLEAILAIDPEEICRRQCKS